MAELVTRKYRIRNAKMFKDSFDSKNMYLFIARVRPWPDDTNPPDPLDTTQFTDFDLWDNILSLKKITAADLSFAIARTEWVSGTVYAPYKVNSEFQNGSFYVVTDEYKVYKCLDNNGGAPSTIKPSSTSAASFTSSDGYKWKFMYSISATEALKFLTSAYAPVKTLTSNDGSLQWNVQQAAANSSIEYVEVTAGGTSYKGHIGTVLTANSTAVTLAPSASAISGTYTNSDFYVISGTGAGQLRKIVSYNGSTKTAVVNTAFSTTPGAGAVYNIGPRVVVVGDGTGFKAYANTTGSAINKVNPIAIGQNYSYANTTFSANGGSGALATAHISPQGGHGADAVKELMGHNVLMSVKLVGSELGTFMTDNEYRVFGLLADPTTAAGATANASIYQQTTRLTFGSPTGTFVNDEKVVGQTSGAIGYVVQYSATNTIALTATRGKFQTSEVIQGQTSGATGTISAIANPELKKYSGTIVYVRTRAPIPRDATQSEDFRFIATY